MKRLAAFAGLVVLAVGMAVGARAAPDYAGDWERMNEAQRKLYYRTVFDGVFVMCDTAYSGDKRAQAMCLQKANDLKYSDGAFSSFMSFFRKAYIERKAPDCPYFELFGDWYRARISNVLLSSSYLEGRGKMCKEIRRKIEASKAR